MKTTLTPHQLADISTRGRAEAARNCPFIDPLTVGKAKRAIRDRGEDWAASVLMRPMTRRSVMFPDMPWLEFGEIETLVLADAAEMDQLARAVAAAEGIEGDLG